MPNILAYGLSEDIFDNCLGIRLLVMLNYQHRYMEWITRELVIKRVAFHTHVPLLVIPELLMSKVSKRNDELSLILARNKRLFRTI